METVVKEASENFVIGGNWEMESKFLREQFPLLTTEDLAYEMGKDEELLGRIQARLYKSREEVLIIIRKWGPDKAVL